jgi:mRNA-degrading endonuclease RelE of RelBE toxin-antitoxin system
MPNELRPKVQIEFTPEVKRNLRALAKKYRLIYYFKTPTPIILLTIYSKLEQADISAEKIRRILIKNLNHSG